MTILASLGFVIFGMATGFVLTWWYVYRAIKTQPHALHSMIESMSREMRADPKAFHALFPDHVCPCCVQAVACPLALQPEACSLKPSSDA